jgi:hypothetical protein
MLVYLDTDAGVELRAHVFRHRTIVLGPPPPERRSWRCIVVIVSLSLG